jgi:hypothetical protein
MSDAHIIQKWSIEFQQSGPIEGGSNVYIRMYYTTPTTKKKKGTKLSCNTPDTLCYN